MKKPVKQKADNALLNSIKSLSAIFVEKGNPLETHIQLASNWAVSHNGIMGIGEKIEQDLFACPNAMLLMSALSKCGQSISITQLEQKLSITSDKFRALVPCMPPENLPRVFPDAPCGPINDRLKAAFLQAAQVPDDENNVVTASVLIQGGSVIATDRRIVLEAYHGNNLPKLQVPKTFARLIKNVKLSFKAFGFSNNSFTVYLENDAWVKTQLYAYDWPDLSGILNAPASPNLIPADLWTALDAIENFSEDGWCYSKNNKLYSHASEDIGASHDCLGIPNGVIFAIEQMQAIKSWVEKIDFFANGPNGLKCIKAFGGNTRCIIAGRV